ncbi:hypothetical protein MPLA_1190044 [Mesorhizobium sp. ORS 3359]|nr:hypothetical protein MPLA_1190044 [Mesorhizobium sp. ORS 3359]
MRAEVRASMALKNGFKRVYSATGRFFGPVERERESGRSWAAEKICRHDRSSRLNS